MKKNKMMRLASCLLVMVLLTTSMISGTFAKYVSEGTGSDSARVAKFGVEVVATGDEAFAEKYNNEADVAGTKVVSSVDNQDVIAPGTNGTLGGIKITGQPEVMVDVAVTAELTLTGWEVEGNTYCPLEFTVGGETIKMTGDIDTIAELEAAVEAKLTALAATNVPANTNLADKNVTVSWAWPFNGDDVKDTALGKLAADENAPTISFTCEAIVTQVD